MSAVESHAGGVQLTDLYAVLFSNLVARWLREYRVFNTLFIIMLPDVVSFGAQLLTPVIVCVHTGTYALSSVPVSLLCTTCPSPDPSPPAIVASFREKSLISPPLTCVQAASIKIYGLLTLSSILMCSKAFLKPDRPRIKWNDLGTQALIDPQTIPT